MLLEPLLIETTTLRERAAAGRARSQWLWITLAEAARSGAADGESNQGPGRDDRQRRRGPTIEGLEETA
jgi:hypothetical protein